jgi:tetratricopeptide (TPR) repeat protein
MSIRRWMALAVFGLALLIGKPAQAFPYGDCAYIPDFYNAGLNLSNYMAEQAIGVSPHPENYACYFYAMGTYLQANGDYEHAIRAYDKAIGWWVQYGDAYEQRGDAYAALGQADKAAQSYEEAKPILDQSDAGRSVRCWLRATRGAPLDRALADCSSVVSDDEANWQALQSRCFVYYRMGSFDKAIADCSASLQLSSRNADALYVKGLAELGKGDATTGKADIAAAKEVDYRIEDLYALYGIKAP